MKGEGGMRRSAHVSAAFLYFLSGCVAATGINIMTGVLTTQSRNGDSLFLIITGASILGLSYLVGRVAAVHDGFERTSEVNMPVSLTAQEREGIMIELRRRRSGQTRKLRLGITLVLVLTVAFLVLREIAIERPTLLPWVRKLLC